MFQTLNAGALCTRDTVFALPQTGVAEAARLMREHHVGSLVVVDETAQGRIVVGMLTDRDIVTSVVAREVDPTLLRVGDVMSRDLATARESDSVLDLLAAMRRRGVRRMPVTDARGVLVGIVAIDDLLGVLAEEMRAIVAALESEAARERSERG